MITAEHPSDEIARLEALLSYELLDTDPEPVFDQLTGQAADVAQTPMALVTLIDADRQWFKSSHGLAVLETPREVAFCAHAVLGYEPLIVEDAATDVRFHDNPLVVGDPRIRFYAGFPLVGPEGHVLGTLCVIDVVPRKLSNEQIENLQALSHEVYARMRLRRTEVRAAAQLRSTDMITGSLSPQELAGGFVDRICPGPPPSHDLVYDLALAMRPLPASVARLAAAVADNDTKINDIVSIVETDPVLVGSIICQANSAASAPVTEITTVDAAVVRLGSAATLAAAIASAVGPRTKAALPAYNLETGQLWTHATATAAIAEKIYRLERSELDPGVVTAALMSEIGQILLNEVVDPQGLNRLIAGGVRLDLAERETLDLDHAEVGATLLQLWQLPAVIVEAVKFHHQPAASDRYEAHAVLVASHLASTLLFERRPNHSQQAFNESVEALGLTETRVFEAALATAHR